MKKLITIILILIGSTLGAQTLMLDCRRAVVEAEMHYYPEYTRTVCAQDYLEYQKDSVAYGFRFFRDTLNIYYGKWICNEISVTMTHSAELRFIESKVGCDCWCPIGPDTWRYRTDAFGNMVMVRRIYQDECVTFVYSL